MDLSGKWSLQEVGTDKIFEATVPGCNYLDLQNNGVISNPFIGDNEKNSAWVAEKDWLYTKEFVMSEADLACDRAYLKFEQLDTISTIILNGQKVADTNNCHVAYSFEVKRLLKSGNNVLTCLFCSPVKYVLEKQAKEHCPINSNGLTGIAHIRKPQCHFGWDFAPNLPISGITGNVSIEFRSGAEINSFEISQRHGAEVSVVINAGILFNDDGCEAEARLIYPDGRIDMQRSFAKDNIAFEFEVSNPELWQPNGTTDRKEQPLYTVELTLRSENSVYDKAAKKIGLRTVELNRDKDKYGENFLFKVNQNPIFCKGASLIPADCYPTRVTKEVVDRYIKIAVDCGFNMLRIWGGGYYGSDYFYEQCDRFGIMVWQDFMFACQAYPFFDDEFTRGVKNEVEYNVNRLKHHASLCLWCGNNEIETMSTAWAYKVKYRKWTEKFFYNILPEELQKYDSVTPYIAGSPIGSGYMKGCSADGCGDTHLWAVWHGLQPLKYYRTRNTRFCSEFGFESLPDMKTIKKFAPAGEYSLNSPVIKAHQKCASGNDKMKYYIAENFRLPKKFEDYIYLSQVCQAMCVADATEYWRRNVGRCNGALYWQFNDCWPVSSWSGLDYYFNYKAVQYEVRKCFEPFTLSLEDGKGGIKVYIVNDRLDKVGGRIKLRLMSFEGDVYFAEEKAVEVGHNQSVCVAEYQFKTFDKKTLRNSVFVAELESGDKKIVKTALFDRERKLNLGSPKIDINVRTDEKYAYYSIKSKRYVRKFALYTRGNEPLSDNYFDLLPNETVTVRQKLGDTTNAEQLRQELSFNHVGLIEPARNRAYDLLVRATVFLKPINFFNYLYYKFLI